MEEIEIKVAEIKRDLTHINDSFKSLEEKVSQGFIQLNEKLDSNVSTLIGHEKDIINLKNFVAGIQTATGVVILALVGLVLAKTIPGFSL